MMPEVKSTPGLGHLAVPWGDGSQWGAVWGRVSALTAFNFWAFRVIINVLGTRFPGDACGKTPSQLRIADRGSRIDVATLTAHIGGRD